MIPVIETPRLRLRNVCAQDDAFVLELLNEPAFLQNIGDRRVRTCAESRAYIADKLASSYEVHGYGLYLVEAREDAAPLGICGFVKREILEHADIGYAFLERFWSRGYAYESAAAVLDYGRSKLGFRCVFGIVNPGNVRSVTLLRKLGLRFKGQVQLPGIEEPRDLLSVTFGEGGPADLPPLPEEYVKRMPAHAEGSPLRSVGRDTSGRDALLVPAAADAWLAMKAAAALDGTELLLVSAFRGVERQREIVARKVASGLALSEILRVSAYPGFSEHHSGRAVDLGAPGCSDLTERFEQTLQFAWLTTHAGRFGFSLTYPRGNRFGIAYEPWHWCFNLKPAHGEVSRG